MTWSAEVGAIRIHAGPGALGLLGALARELGGGRVLVVTDPGVRSAGHVDSALAALEGLADSLRVELAPRRIGITTVYPSLTRTEFFDHLAAGSAPSLEGKWAEDPETVLRTIKERHASAC